MGKTFYSVHLIWAEMREREWHGMAWHDGHTWAWVWHGMVWSEGPRKGLRGRAPLFLWSLSLRTTRPRACHARSLAGGGGAAGAGPCFRFRIRKALFEAPARVSPASPFAGPSSSRRGRAGSTAARGSERLRPGGLRNRGFTGGGRVWGKEGKDSEAERLGLGWAGGDGGGVGWGGAFMQSDCVRLATAVLLCHVCIASPVVCSLGRWRWEVRGGERSFW